MDNASEYLPKIKDILPKSSLFSLENLALNDLMSVAKENMAAQHHYLPNANELEQIRKCLSSVQSLCGVQRGMHALTVSAMSLLLVRMKREALYRRGTNLLLEMKLPLNYRYTKMRNEFAPDVEKRTRVRQAYLKSVSREAEISLRLMPEMQTHLEGILKAV
ncbi:unnamed protein product [Notodromas monacha]|uniref:Uncharacterized protein n=1 Tax=Notodromas monacha TaxID=399045 RepID=A0A7R9GIZ4_9CRUS|nr:unnamed protein product [Notodromas monacha]CAG0922341.1 unnamed protein product [Notodromas monacha]